MLTVGKIVSEVERRLSEGLLACPDCGGRLVGWGFARPRVVRGLAERAGSGSWRPRRTRCCGCGVTHVLLPVNALVRRADAAGVIGAGLLLAAAGWGHRRIAERLGRPPATVRGWVRRLRARAEALRSAFTELLVAVDPDPVPPGPRRTGLADAVAAIVAASVATARRWAAAVGGLSPWELAAAVTSGRLLAPAPALKLINTSCPW